MAAMPSGPEADGQVATSCASSNSDTYKQVRRLLSSLDEDAASRTTARADQEGRGTGCIVMRLATLKRGLTLAFIPCDPVDWV